MASPIPISLSVWIYRSTILRQFSTSMYLCTLMKTMKKKNQWEKKELIGKEETENTNHNTPLEWHFMDFILVMTLYGVPQSLSEHMYGVCYVA